MRCVFVRVALFFHTRPQNCRVRSLLLARERSNAAASVLILGGPVAVIQRDNLSDTLPSLAMGVFRSLKVRYPALHAITSHISTDRPSQRNQVNLQMQICK